MLNNMHRYSVDTCTIQPAKYRHHRKRHAFIYSFLSSFTRESFLANLFVCFDVGFLLMDIEIFQLDRLESWMVHYNKLPLNCKVCQHWIDDQTHWVCDMVCHWTAHIMSCEQTNMLHIQSWDTLLQRRQWQRIAMKTKRKRKRNPKTTVKSKYSIHKSTLVTANIPYFAVDAHAWAGAWGKSYWCLQNNLNLVNAIIKSSIGKRVKND